MELLTFNLYNQGVVSYVPSDCGHSETSQEWQDSGEQHGAVDHGREAWRTSQKSLKHSLNWSRLPQEAENSETKVRNRPRD